MSLSISQCSFSILTSPNFLPWWSSRLVSTRSQFHCDSRGLLLRSGGLDLFLVGSVLSPSLPTLFNCADIFPSLYVLKFYFLLYSVSFLFFPFDCVITQRGLAPFNCGHWQSIYNPTDSGFLRGTHAQSLCAVPCLSP